MYIPELEYYHVHTMLSNVFTQTDSTMTVEDYAKEFTARGCKTFCLTEHGNRSDVFAQSDLAEKYATESNKMIPIVGAECYFVPNRNPELKDKRNFHLVVIGKNNDALKQLNLMLSRANETGYFGHARVDYELLSQLNPNNFIVTTACVGGILRDQQGEEMCDRLHDMFGHNFYLEVQPHLVEKQIEFNKRIVDLYKRKHIPLILGTDSHYITHEDKLIREEAMKNNGIQYDDEGWDLYLPTNEEVYTMLSQQNVFTRAQIEESMENTLILREFEGVSFDKQRKFPIAKDRRNLSQKQRDYVYQKLVCDGYVEKFGQPNEYEKSELRREMNVVLETQSSDYFIGLHDMIARGIENGGVITQTSRGSACGFATNAALGFTTINRLHTPVPIYPERFITKEKLAVSMPDIDTNVADAEPFFRAGQEVFGEHSCYPMIAYGKMKTLAAFKMLAKARDVDFETANEISKQIKQYELDKKHAIENNQDDPDYNVDDDVNIMDYVEEKYVDLINDSKMYENIITSISPHPCAHLVYHTDLREDIGVISLKGKSGSERKLALYIDGATADEFGYCKIDLLTVTIVKLISNTFKRIGMKPISTDELLKFVENNEDVWSLYKNGYTQNLNQCEKEKTTQKCMTFKPKNVVELSAFVASIRPGAKSLVDDYVNRTKHTYDIPALDDLLRLNGATGITGESSFLFYDENVLQLGQAAGIDPGDAYMLIKNIKKKKHDKVAKYKDRFIPGFIDYLKTKQSVSEELAEKTANDVWKIIIDSASYLFNASHSYAMALDSLYGAYLKVNYPYEFYVEMLKHCTEKGDIKKIALIVAEMKKYKGIRMTAAKFGQDSRDWFVDKESSTISQSMSSIKYVSDCNADDMFNIKDKHFDTFTDMLREIQMNTSINTRQLQSLVYLNYFEQFGKRDKLLTICNEFFEGKNKVTKTVKSFEKRMSAIKEVENTLENKDIPIEDVVLKENELIGMCMSSCKQNPVNEYLVMEVDDTYSPKVKLYSINRGTFGTVKVKKSYYESKKIKPGDIIFIIDGLNSPKCNYKNGKRQKIAGEYEYWIREYAIR